jgi:hypothetical protein
MDIRDMHETESRKLDKPFPNTPLFADIQEAIRFFERAHRHRGLLLVEVERLRRERDEALARWENRLIDAVRM